jgi:hypothetical protein
MADSSSPDTRESAAPFLVRSARDGDVDAIFRVHSDSIRGLCSGRYGAREIEAWIAFRPPEAYRAAFASR